MVESTAAPQIWRSCQVVSFYEADNCSYSSCNVKLDHELLIEYVDEGAVVQYRGANDGSGHFLLKSSQVAGTATMHLTPGTLVLEGSWVEDGHKGMWKIFLRD